MRRRLAAEQIRDSVDALARALPAQLSAFEPWRRRDPAFKPIASGSIWTSAGPRRHAGVVRMLDTGAAHCFICAHLARAVNLPASRSRAPRSSAWRRRTPVAPCLARW